MDSLVGRLCYGDATHCQALESRSITLPAGQGCVTDIFIQSGSSSSIGIGLPLRESSACVAGICLVAPFHAVWPTSCTP